MKKIIFFIAFSMLLFIGCDSDDETGFPSSENPAITIVTNEIYGAPNDEIEIKAALSDDLGLKSVQIQIPELALDKTINFSVDPLLKNYDLSYFFEIPSDRGTSETFSILVMVSDVSGNLVQETINLRLDGEFSPPAISMVTPKDGAVILLSSSNQMPVNFIVNDDSGIDFIHLECEELGINDLIELTDAPQSYTFNKTYTLPVNSANYVLTITVKDKFVLPNTGTLKVNVIGTNEYPALYLCDQPKGTNLTTDVAGVPMYFHEKDGQDFEFKYYANTDNKEIYFLGQESDFAPHCFGLDGSGALVDDVASQPIILPTKGYYKIKVNPNELTYSLETYTPTSKVWENVANGLWHDEEAQRKPFVSVCGAGIQGATWDTWDAWTQKGLHLANNPQNPYQLVGAYTVTGTFEATFTGQWWDPSWRLIKNGIATMSPGENSNGKYPAVPGVYKVILDTELERVFITKQ